MKLVKEFRSVVALGLALCMMAACGSPSITVADVPAYPGAVELKPGESKLADTLKQNGATAAEMGAKVEQRGFSLPKDASWDKVNAFYADKLKAGGWSEGVGGGGVAGAVAGAVAGNAVANALKQANNNDTMQTAIYSKGTQTLSLFRLVLPSNKDTVELILSLNTR